MEIANVIEAIVTKLRSYSWESPSGRDITSLQTVVNCPNYIPSAGYPSACVYDNSMDGVATGNRTYSLNTTVNIDLYVSPSSINKSTDIEKLQEAYLRLREAWDYIKTQIFSVNFGVTIGVDILSKPNYRRLDLRGQETNVIGYRITMLIKEKLER